MAKRVWRTATGESQGTEGPAKGKRAAAECDRRSHGREAGPEGHRPGKLLSPERRRFAVQHARDKGLSERHACRLVGQPRGTQRYQPTQGDDEDQLTKAIVALATEYGRYGYRRITALLQQAGWNVGKDRVQRIWRREGLRVPAKQKPRRRLWLNDGSCIRLRPERPNHVWSYDFVEARTHDGRSPAAADHDRRVHPAVRGDPGGSAVEQLSRDRDTGRLDARAWRSRACTVPQWRGDDSGTGEEVASDVGHQAVIYRASQPPRKSIPRIVLRP